MAAELFAYAVVGVLLVLCGLIHLLASCCREAKLGQFCLNMRLYFGMRSCLVKVWLGCI